MNKTKLLSTLFIGFFAVAILTQCTDSKSGTDDKASTGKEMKGEDKGADNDKANPENGASDKGNEGDENTEDLKKMTPKEGELSFETGSWADRVLQALNAGNTQTFTLDQIPYGDDEGDDEKLSDAGNKQLDNLAEILKANPDWKIEVQGHTEAPEKKLGETTKKAGSLLKAKWVQGKMNLRGITGKQISAKGYGSDELMEGVDPSDKSHRRIMISLSK